MKTIKLSALLILFTLCLSSLAFGAKGVVARRINNCDYFLVHVADTDDFSLVEWYGGYDPVKGDVVYGKLNDFGFHNLYYSGRETRVWIEDYGLAAEDALEQLFEQCD